MTQVETEAIAQGMLQITDEFQKQTGIADEVVDRIIEHSFRKNGTGTGTSGIHFAVIAGRTEKLLFQMCGKCTRNGKHESKGGWSECVKYADKPHATQDVPMHRSQNLLKGVACAARESARATST